MPDKSWVSKGSFAVGDGALLSPSEGCRRCPPCPLAAGKKTINAATPRMDPNREARAEHGEALSIVERFRSCRIFALQLRFAAIPVHPPTSDPWCDRPDVRSSPGNREV